MFPLGTFSLQMIPGETIGSANCFLVSTTTLVLGSAVSPVTGNTGHSGQHKIPANSDIFRLC